MSESQSETRVMGLDVGDRRVGVALSDPTRLIAQGLEVLHRTRRDADVAALAALCATHAVDAIVVGWPLRLSGRPGIQTRKVQQFIDALAAVIDLPIHKWDERLSTVAAERALREGGVRAREQRAVVDKVAATLILQGWLDAQRAQGG